MGNIKFLENVVCTVLSLTVYTQLGIEIRSQHASACCDYLDSVCLLRKWLIDKLQHASVIAKHDYLKRLREDSFIIFVQPQM